MVGEVTRTTWESKSSLLDHLARSTRPTLVVGGHGEAPRTFESLLVTSAYGECELGVVTSGIAPFPGAAWMKGGLVLGYDCALTWIDLAAVAVRASVRLEGVFYELAVEAGTDEAVVVHELGALRVDAAGTVRWSTTTHDVVDGWERDSRGDLILRLMDGSGVVVDATHGTVSSRDVTVPPATASWRRRS